MQQQFQKRLLAPESGSCVCSQVRKLARKLSSFYDSILAPEDLTITQYSLMANIARSGELPHTLLAEKVGMERTTLTRNLRPLIRGQLVRIVPGLDRRQKLLQLTSTGTRKLARALPLWEQAQDGFVSHFGSGQTNQLRRLIRMAQSAVSNAVGESRDKEARIAADTRSRSRARILERRS
jgi:DNA-binding MarR family transcriptional regulator